MDLEVLVYMDSHFLMKAFRDGTHMLVYCQWQIPDLTQTLAYLILHLRSDRSWIINEWYSDR